MTSAPGTVPILQSWISFVNARNIPILETLFSLPPPCPPRTRRNPESARCLSRPERSQDSGKRISRPSRRGEIRPSLGRKTPLPPTPSILFRCPLDGCSIPMFNQLSERDAGPPRRANETSEVCTARRATPPPKNGAVALRRGKTPLQRGTKPPERGTFPLSGGATPLQGGRVPLPEGRLPPSRGTPLLRRGTASPQRGTAPLQRGIGPFGETPTAHGLGGVGIFDN
jgi:hypothetical protein